MNMGVKEISQTGLSNIRAMIKSPSHPGACQENASSGPNVSMNHDWRTAHVSWVTKLVALP